MVDNQKTEILPLDIIFSCSVCQATFSEIYANLESDKGFRGDGHSEERHQITKLWLTKCGHLTCTKHLEGGGIPFHRAGDQPQAVCPTCASERNDTQKTAFFAIRGSADGEHDSAIPKNWFDAPPINLDGRGKDLDALRFHYLSLVRFGTKLLPRLRSVEKQAELLKNQASDESARSKALSCRLEKSESRLKQLDKCEEQLNKWRKRESKIKFYLGLFVHITKENEELREQLTAMGYAVPARTYSTDPDDQFNKPYESGSPYTDNLVNNNAAHSAKQLNDPFEPLNISQDPVNLRTASDRTLSGLAEPDLTFNNYNYPQSVRKRTRHDQQFTESQEFDSNSRKMARGESRRLMPPPPLPTIYQAPSRPNRNVSAHLEPEQHRFQQSDSMGSFDLRRRGISDSEGMPSPAKNPGPFYPLDQAQHRLNHGNTISSRDFDFNSSRNATEIPPVQNSWELQSNPISREYKMSGALRSPLYEQSPSRSNIQQYHDDTGGRDGLYPSKNAQNLSQQQFRSQPSPTLKTPSPTKYSARLPGNQSVISPFFSRASVEQHTGRMTFPPNSTTVRAATHEKIQHPISKPYLSSRTGIPAARNVRYPARKASQATSLANTVAHKEQYITPRARYSDTGFSEMLARQHHQVSQPPSSPYFQRQTRQSQLKSSPNQIHPPATPQAQLFSQQRNVREYAYHPERPSLDRSSDRQMHFQPEPGQPTHFNENVQGREYLERIGTSTGLKSGVSRLSSERVRESHNPLAESRLHGWANTGNDPITSRVYRTRRW